MNGVASDDTCDGEWGDGNRSPKAWASKESWWASSGTSFSWGDDLDWAWSCNIWMSVRAPTTWYINVIISQGSVCHILYRCGSCMISLTCVHGTLSLSNKAHMRSTISMQTLWSGLCGMIGLCPTWCLKDSSSIFSSCWGGLSPTYLNNL